MPSGNSRELLPQRESLNVYSFLGKSFVSLSGLALAKFATGDVQQEDQDEHPDDGMDPAEQQVQEQ